MASFGNTMIIHIDAKEKRYAVYIHTRGIADANLKIVANKKSGIIMSLGNSYAEQIRYKLDKMGYKVYW